MSFQNFEPFQTQHPAADVAAAPVAAADPAITGQADPTAAFQGPAPGEPTAIPAPPPSDGKTTLWYV